MAKTASAPAKLPRTRQPVDQEAPHLMAQERAARGKAARREVPGESHAEYKAAKRRPDP